MNQREKFEAWLRSIWTPGYDCRRGPGGDSYAHREAQNYWVAWQAALAASGGNAAPGLTDERAAFIDASQLNGTMASTNADGSFTDPWVEAHFAGWQLRANFAAASAPNAALVAALKEALECFLLDHSHDHPTANRWRAALSAAGQEVGHG